jgi:hypothetical protein
MTSHGEIIDVSGIAEVQAYSGVGLGVLFGEGTCHGRDAEYPLGRRHPLGHSRCTASGVEGRRTKTRAHHYRYRRIGTVPPDSSAFRRTETT